ncbi:cytochrome c maturation protein CcmE [Salmonella enterica subsp. enterica serovar Weltevreden]|nr:cytochrome c maturation protein CcmE [Salmonella enterica subsp. enterica serovar Weltevreden]
MLAGLGLTTARCPSALRANIDLFYTPGEILLRQARDAAAAGGGPASARRRGMVMPGSVRRDRLALKVNFSLLRRRRGGDGELREGILPDLFREGRRGGAGHLWRRANSRPRRTRCRAGMTRTTPPEVKRRCAGKPLPPATR